VNIEQIILEESLTPTTFKFPDATYVTKFRNFVELNKEVWILNNRSFRDKVPDDIVYAGSILYAFLVWCLKTKGKELSVFFREYNPEEPINALTIGSVKGIDLAAGFEVTAAPKKGWYVFSNSGKSYTLPTSFNIVPTERGKEKERGEDKELFPGHSILDKFMGGIEKMSGRDVGRFAKQRRE
jgi:hypothetical protein